MPLLFNGQTLVAHYHKGDSDFLLVTFSGIYHEEEAERSFLLKQLVAGSDVSCVGITTRKRSLYIDPEIGEIAAAVRSLRTPGQKVVLLGQSAGGYAAAKYASLFGADYVVGFAPIYSLDPSDLELTDDYRISVLRTATRFHRIMPSIIAAGMKPTPADCPVPLVVVFDSDNDVDAYAAAMFSRRLPQVFVVPARHMGHQVFDRMGQTGALLHILETLKNGEVLAARDMLSNHFRNNPEAITELLVKIARWNPGWMPRALSCRRVVNNMPKKALQAHHFNAVLAFHHVERGELAAAYRHLGSLHPTVFPRAAADPNGASPPSAQTGMFVVLSYHGDVLKCDPVTRELRFRDQIADAEGEVTVLLDTSRSQPRFFCRLRARDVEIQVDRHGEEGGQDGFRVVPFGPHLVTFERNGAFLRAERSGKPAFTAGKADKWESFALVPVPASSSICTSTTVNWFEQVSMVTSTEQPPVVAARRRPTSFRSKLQQLFG